jgi:hypothetical protein
MSQKSVLGESVQEAIQESIKECKYGFRIESATIEEDRTVMKKDCAITWRQALREGPPASIRTRSSQPNLLGQKQSTHACA